MGTKGTALLALPGLAIAGLVLFGRRPTRRILGGLLLGGVAAVLLGSYVYLQNWRLYGTPIPPAFALESGVGVMTGQGFVANLGRILFTFVFADLTGPLNDPRARPLIAPLTELLGTIGERVFALFGIPTVVEGVDVPWWPTFTFIRTARDFVPEGPGPIGGLMLILAMLALVWPARSGWGPRLLGLAALGYLVGMALTLRWNASAGRFLLTACALAAPLLGAVIERREPSDRGRRWRWAFALFVAVWSAASGLYALGLRDHRVIERLAGRDRIGLLSLSPLVASHEPLFREVEEELGPTAVAVYDTLSGVPNRKDQWEYPFFGPRFSRVVVPLVRPEYPERMGLLRPLAWTNERLVEAYRPSYVAVAGRRPAGGALAQIGLDGCFPVPLRHGKPALPWELWRCRDDDPRSVVENGDFRAWPMGLPIGWNVEVAGEGRLTASWTDAEAQGAEPFRLRLDYRAGDAEDEAGIVQEVPIGGLRGRTLVVDARVRADLEGAAVLWVDDGVTATQTANATAGAETLRVTHRIDPRATGLWVHLDASGAGQDAIVLARTILAIPRGGE
ncbi:MAG: hypothetical protein H0V51_09640 [Chloroflexi bacterium]|nr:hypothetical protein [Chloroflexota bacterium]